MREDSCMYYKINLTRVQLVNQLKAILRRWSSLQTMQIWYQFIYRSATSLNFLSRTLLSRRGGSSRENIFLTHGFSRRRSYDRKRMIRLLWRVSGRQWRALWRAIDISVTFQWQRRIDFCWLHGAELKHPRGPRYNRRRRYRLSLRFAESRSIGTNVRREAFPISDEWYLRYKYIAQLS